MYGAGAAARAALMAFAVSLLGACALASQPAAPLLFDLGPLPARAAAQATPALPLQLQEVSAPSWLAGTGIAYRLDYLDAFRREVYRDSRWVAPPAALLAERLRARAAAGAPGAARAAVPLRLELEEFAQSFAAPGQSQVRLRVRAWRGAAPAQLRVFEVSRPAPSADAAGAVQALSLASDELIDQLLAWAAAP